MRRLREWTVPVVVLVLFVGLAVMVLTLLDDARTRGISALEEAIEAQTAAIAGAQDERLTGLLQSVAGFTSGRWELEIGSAADQERLDFLARLGDDLQAGFYVLDREGTITAGVLLDEDAEALGDRFEWPGWEGLDPRQTAGRVLPVGRGYTTRQPVLAIVLPLTDPGTLEVSGAFVLENVVSADSALNEEISALRRGTTGEFMFFDGRGTVIAASDPEAIARPVADHLLGAGPGFHRSGDVVAAVADVPTVGWRVAFQQDASEFDEPMSGPLDTIARVLVLTLLVVGGLAVLLLGRRLQASRQEQQRLLALAESQEEFVSIVSHELRTPVAGVLGFLQTTIDHWDQLDEHERLDTVRRAASNARRLQGLTRDILDAQNAEAGRLVYAFERLDVRDEVRDAVEAARALAGDRPFELELVDGPALVEADGDRLQQVFANLLDNAVKNSPPSSPVTVAVARADGSVDVTVRDHGPGLPQEARERIFDKFVRGRSDSVSGTGLGLYIARQIIESHGGTIGVETSGGDGVVFRVRLPSVD